jgi:cytidylate kinase
VKGEKMVITIGREFGSGGKYIGERLAEELNLKLYDKELLNKVAEESGMDLNILEQIDEKQEECFWYLLPLQNLSNGICVQRGQASRYRVSL